MLRLAFARSLELIWYLDCLLLGIMHHCLVLEQCFFWILKFEVFFCFVYLFLLIFYNAGFNIHIAVVYMFCGVWYLQVTILYWVVQAYVERGRWIKWKSKYLAKGEENCAAKKTTNMFNWLNEMNTLGWIMYFVMFILMKCILSNICISSLIIVFFLLTMNCIIYFYNWIWIVSKINFN